MDAVTKQRARILYVHHGSARGGAPLSLLFLLEHLDRERYEFVVCSGTGDPEVLALFRRVAQASLKCALAPFQHTTGGGYDLLKVWGWRQLYMWIRQYGGATRRLEAVLERVRPDVVHLNSLTLAPYARIAASRDIPVIVHLRESVLPGLLGLRRAWLRWIVNRYATRLVAVCYDGADRLGAAAAKSIIVRNPVDVSRFNGEITKESARQQLGVSQEARVVLWAGGSVQREKGLPEFLAAMDLVASAMDHLVCLMPGFLVPAPATGDRRSFRRRLGKWLGRGRDEEKVRQLVRRVKAKAELVTAEFTYDIEKWIAAADVVCVPHVAPHFSRTAIEAGAMRRPVVAFRIGGVEEAVAHEVTGLLVECADVPQLAAAVRRVLLDGALSRRLGEGGWRQARSEYLAEHVARRMDALYREIIREHDQATLLQGEFAR